MDYKKLPEEIQDLIYRPEAGETYHKTVEFRKPNGRVTEEILIEDEP